MLNIRKLFTVFCLAIGLVSSAMLVTAKPLHAQEAGGDNWSGLSLSVGAGAKSLDSDVNGNLTRLDFGCLTFIVIGCGFSAQDGQANISEDDWKAFGTAQIAFDQKIGSFVIGVFADLDFGQDHSSSNTVTGLDFNICGIVLIAVIDCPTPADGIVGVVESEIGTTWTVGGRLGYLVSPTWLIYGLVAYSETDLKAKALIADPFSGAGSFAGDQPTNASFKTEINGLTLGAGTEFQIAQNVHLKFEYRYTDFNSESFSMTNFNAVGVPANFQLIYEDVNLNIDSEVHSVRAAIVLKFGDPMQAFY